MTDDCFLPNPEAGWAGRPTPGTSLREEVEARIGPAAGPIERLPAGLARSTFLGTLLGSSEPRPATRSD